MRIKLLLEKILIITVLLAAIFPSVKQIVRPGFFPMHDDIQGMRLLELDKCIKDRQIPCRWVPDMGWGYGYPQFNYYGPLPYYIMEGLHLTGLGYLDSIKAGMILIAAVSVLAMYLLSSSLWGKWGGLISAILYAYAPYRAVDFYVRGDIGELAALAIIPFLFWSVKRILSGDSKSTVWLALSVAALLTSHNISSLIFLPILAIWTVFLIFLDKGNVLPKIKQKILFLLFGGVWGLMLGAFFFLPAWFEKNYAHIETILMGYFNYLAHFVSINQLLFSTYWNYGASEAGPWDELFLGVGIIHWIMPLLATALLFVLKKKKELLVSLFFVMVGWMALFMVHEKSTFIWNSIPILSYLQFPWRFLLVSTFTFSVAAGAVGILFANKKQFSILVILIYTILILFYSSYFKPSKWLSITDSQKFSGDSWTRQMTISIFDYLPVYAKHPPTAPAPEKPLVLSGNASIFGVSRGTDWQKWNIEVTKDAVIQLPLFDFPIWRVWIDGKTTNVSHNNELGLITFNIGPGSHLVYVKLTNTPVRIIANTLSLIGFLGIPLYFIFRRKIK